ncbi:MAG: class I SAM-dependent methyltransferase [Acidobacteria bacterium]|nr:class I SAM-dependent methyltransferase [Acidobacteriota bacterium]MBI3656066.1 class I SAM-dependent methyltransferase [Acidobacteriota bacterium]
MKIQELQRHWNALGKIDPLWAILTDPQRKNGKWNLKDFFSTGDEEIANAVAYIESLGFPLKRRTALDFGCGVGRLTQALSNYFENCSGIDISPSMIDLAQKFDRSSGRCRYFLNTEDNLKIIADNSCDFVYSNIVLQHMEPRYMIRYIKEFFRVCSPGGLLLFQVPCSMAASRHPVRTGGPLADHDFRARIGANVIALSKEAGSTFPIIAKITNLSSSAWYPCGNSDNRFTINLGNHWLDQDQNLIVLDDGRAALTGVLLPNQEVDLELYVNAPNQPGRYILELDLVQEQVAWFTEKGSETLKIDVILSSPSLDEDDLLSASLEGTIEGSTDFGPILALDRTSPDEFSPIMEMHSIDREVLIEILRILGGELRDVVEDHWAGPSFKSYRYCVSKPAIPESRSNGP